MYTDKRKPYSNIFCLACRVSETDIAYSDMKCYRNFKEIDKTCFDTLVCLKIIAKS